MSVAIAIVLLVLIVMLVRRIWELELELIRVQKFESELSQAYKNLKLESDRTVSLKLKLSEIQRLAGEGLNK